ncbi:MAG: hypothetical protein AAGC79_02670 [Pseudomonadota bacterium]
MTHLSEAMLRRLDAAAMHAIAVALMGVFVARILVIPLAADASAGHLVICGAGGMTVIELEGAEGEEALDLPSCSEHCVQIVEFRPAITLARTPLVVATRAFPPINRNLTHLSPTAFRPRAPPFIA